MRETGRGGEREREIAERKRMKMSTIEGHTQKMKREERKRHVTRQQVIATTRVQNIII